MDSVDSKFVMQVRAGAEASGAYVADHLTLRDRTIASDILGKAGEVCVERTVFLAMLENDDLAVPAFSANKFDLPVGSRPYWIADSPSIIDSVVGTPFLFLGMVTAF